MKYSFNTWAFSSYPNWLPAYPIEEVITRLSDLGYDAVELGCTAPHAWPDFMDSQERQRLRRYIESRHMVFSTLLPVTGVGAGANAASANPKERAWTVKHLCDVCDLAEDLGCCQLLYVPGFFIYGTRREDAWKYAMESLVGIGLYAEKKGIRLLIEPTSADSNLCETVEDALEMKRESGLANIDIMFDVYHALFRTDQPADYVRLYGQEIKHVHLSDYNRKVPGDGGFDFTELMQEFKNVGFDGYLTMEASFTSRAAQPFNSARRAINYLKSIEKQLR